MHAKTDPSNMTFHVRCKWCSRKQQREVFHIWTWEQVIRANRAGRDVVWPLDGTDLDQAIENVNTALNGLGANLECHDGIGSLEHPRCDGEGDD